ncbi:MAG: DUF1015 family protein [Bacteroidia bacterium]
MLDPIVGYRYEKLESRWAPVYDALTPTRKQQLYSDTTNAIHIALPQNPIQSLHLWNHWQNQLLLKEPVPALYAYSQTFVLAGDKLPRTRWGVIAGIRLESHLRPHENTLPAQVQKQVQAWQTLPVQTTPVHVLAADGIQDLLRDYLSCPLFYVVDEGGVLHKLTPIHHRAHIEEIQKVLVGPYTLADGHHRWQAAREMGFRHLLAYLSPLTPSEIIVRPIHRAIRQPPPDALKRLTPYFEVRPASLRRPLWEEVRIYKFAAGLQLHGKEYILLPKRESLTLHSPHYPQALYELVVTWVDDFLLSRAWENPIVEYTKEVTALSLVPAAIVLPTPPADTLWHLLEKGFTLPPKSTYFYPKVLSGLVFYHARDFSFGLT